MTTEAFTSASTFMRTPLWFMLLFALPIAWQRLKRLFLPQSFVKLNFVRRHTGVNLHHGHLGLFMILGIGFWLAFFPRTWKVWMLDWFVFGLGLLTDEIIPYFSSTVGADRKAELEIYDQSCSKTICLAVVIALLVGLCSYLARL
jgi:hypothetical protein